MTKNVVIIELLINPFSVHPLRVK